MVTLAFLLILIYGSGYAFADDNLKYPTLVRKLAQKFNLKEEEINEVFEQERQEMWENRQKIRDENLDRAVADGVITSEQKTKFLEKMDEIQAEKSAERQEHRDEMIFWMEENNIDHEKLYPYLGRINPGGYGVKEGHARRMFQSGSTIN